MSDETVMLKIAIVAAIFIFSVTFFIGLVRFYKTLGTENAANNLSLMLFSFVAIYVTTCIYGNLQ